jgi:hypothetical protein
VSQLVSLAELPTPALGASIQGELASVHLESLLHMLSEDGVRGVLTVTRGKAVARLHLDRGRLRMAEVQDTAEDLRLGRFIVEAGFLDDEILENLAKAADPQRRPLGIRLVEEGHLQPEELGQSLIDQAREVTCHLLTWDRGQVTFATSKELHPLAEAASDNAVELRIADALLEGQRRVDEQAEMGPHMAGVDEVWLRVDEEVARRGRHAFTREELGVLELLNGRNSVKEIARKTRTGTFAVAKVLYRLSRAKLARRRLDPVQV